VFGLATTYICKLEFLTVIHVGYSDFTLGYVIVVVNVIGEEAHVYIHIVGREVFLWFSKKNRTYALSLGYHIFNAHVLYAVCVFLECFFGVFVYLRFGHYPCAFFPSQEQAFISLNGIQIQPGVKREVEIKSTV